VQQTAVTGDATHRVRRQALAIIEFAAAVAVVVSERFRANVHHDLITVSRGQLPGTVAQRGFRHRRQCVSTALCKPILYCGRYRGNVFGFRIRFLRIHRGSR